VAKEFAVDVSRCSHLFFSIWMYRCRAKAAPKRKPGRPKKAAPAPEAVEESDDDEVSSDEEAEFDMETFDPQKLVNDEEDQKYLDSLPEFEREAILGERFEKRKADMDMKKALRDAK
jgi:RNA polymerase-associated protein RTF1